MVELRDPRHPIDAAIDSVRTVRPPRGDFAGELKRLIESGQPVVASGPRAERRAAMVRSGTRADVHMEGLETPWGQPRNIKMPVRSITFAAK